MHKSIAKANDETCTNAILLFRRIAQRKFYKNSQAVELGINCVIIKPDGMTSADVNVEYDDETNLVTVEMSRKTNNFSSNMSWVETLPKDADPDTLSATVVNGVFTLIVDKLPEPSPEPVEESKADSIFVEVKRKNRKTFEG